MSKPRVLEASHAQVAHRTFGRIAIAYVISVFCALCFLISPSGTVAADGRVALEGSVHNGSKDNSMNPAGIEVTLHKIGLGAEDSTVVVTDKGGYFRFDDLRLVPGVAYGVSVQYKGVLYGTDIETDTALEEPVEMTVFEVTDNIGLLGVDSISVLFADVDKKLQRVTVLESVVLENYSDTTYVPGRDPMSIVRFSLPVDAADLSVSTSLLRADVFQVDVGFGVTSSIPPGKHEILYSYSFPYEKSPYTFEKRLLYGAEMFRVVWDSDLFDLAVASQSDVESVDLGTRAYKLSEIEQIGRGEEISIELLELPAASGFDRFSASVSNLPLQYAPPVIVAIVLLGIVPLVLFARRRNTE